MPLPFDFQGKGVDFCSDLPLPPPPLTPPQLLLKKWQMEEGYCYVGTEKSSSPTSSLTHSSSLISGGSTALETGSSGGGSATALKICGDGVLSEWDNVLSEFASSPGTCYEPYVMGTGGQLEFDFGGGFGDLGFGVAMNPTFRESISGSPSDYNGGVGNLIFSNTWNNLVQNSQQFLHFQQPNESLSSQLLTSYHQAQPPHQNPALFPPLSFNQPEHQYLLSSPDPKRLNTKVLDQNNQILNIPFASDIFSQTQRFPRHLRQQDGPSIMAAPGKSKLSGEDAMLHQQAIIDQIFKVVELIETGNSVHAQGILARLNHQLSPIGKPFQRIAFYFKESLNLLLNFTNNGSSTMSATNSSPFNLIFKIGAYKLFSEISPFVQFANFTCNQAILEALEGFDRIHIIDFDIGYGGQWSSLMQELALKNGGPPFLKITIFASPSTYDELELSLACENLNHFANELNIPFELEIVNLELINSMPINSSKHEAIAVNLPISSFTNHPSSLPLVLRFVKQLSPKIVVSLARGYDRIDLPFPHRVIHALQSFSTLLESIDAVNLNFEAMQKIERFVIHPGIEKIVMGRNNSHDQTPPWKNLFLACGFSPLSFSNFTESQADCLVQRTPVRGFHFEKKQSSLVLCWQQKDLISASAWRC